MKKQNLVLLCPTSMKAIQIGWYSCLDRSHRIVCELYELGVNFKQIGLEIVPRMKLKFIFGLLFFVHAAKSKPHRQKDYNGDQLKLLSLFF